MAEPYVFGVDLGGSRVHGSAVRRVSGAPIHIPVRLGETHYHLETEVFVDAKGHLEFAEKAAFRASADPQHLLKNIRHRVGDSVPPYIRGQRIEPAIAIAQLIALAVARATAALGEAPTHLVVTVPADWGAYRRTLVEDALSATTLPPFHVVSETEAALTHITSEPTPAVPGASEVSTNSSTPRPVALFDLGTTTLHITLALRQGADLAAIPHAERHVLLGGEDMDDSILGAALAALPAGTAPTHADLARLRAAITQAKEDLSTHLEVTVPLPIPTNGTPATFRLSRAEAEALMAPTLERAIAEFEGAINQAGYAPSDLATVYLFGGSAHIPMLARLLDTLGPPVKIPGDPDLVIAHGAALLGLPLLPAPDDSSAPDWDETGASQDSDVPTRPHQGGDRNEVNTDAGPAPRFTNPDQKRQITLPFLHASGSAATWVWRLILLILILGTGVFLWWAFTSDTSPIFADPSAAEGRITPPHATIHMSVLASISPGHLSKPIDVSTSRGDQG